jgi:Uma2 family endonuclease
MKKGATMAPAPAMTVDEYLQTPESTLPQELAYGVWRVAEAPTVRHQCAVFAFGVALDGHVRRRGLGCVYLAPVDVVLDRSRHLVVQPDLVLVSHDRLEIVSDRIWGAPDLALEVLSPRPRIGELRERLGWFATYGVRECWLLHQDDRVVEVVELAGGQVANRRRFAEDAAIESALLPDWHETLAGVLEGFDA